MAEIEYFTQAGLQKLKDELDRLILVERPKVVQAIAEARDKGDLSENAEYDAAKDEQAKLEGEIVELEMAIRSAVVVSDDDITTEKVNVGTTIRVRDEEDGYEEEYRLVGPHEADPMNGAISVDSPMGHALLGKKVGEIAQVEAPVGIIRMKVVSIART